MDVYTVAGENRFIGNVTATAKFLKKKTIVGFENHSGLTYLNAEAEPFMKVKSGMATMARIKVRGQETEMFLALIYMDRFYLKILNCVII